MGAVDDSGGRGDSAPARAARAGAEELPAHKRALDEALALEADAQRRLMDGDRSGASEQFARAAERYRTSWEAAGPASYGRLVGLLKARLLADGAAGAGAPADGPRAAAAEAAAYVRVQLDPSTAATSAVAAYALAVAALVAGDDQAACAAADAMLAGGGAFARTAEALDAIARGDDARYGAAVAAIVADFESRDAHLTGVAIADTALMLDILAAPRGLPELPASPVLPPRR